MLILPIKRKWFDMITSGEKKEEYREIKPYYNKCLGNKVIGFPFTDEIVKNFKNIKQYDEKQFKNNIEIIFRNGYTYDSPSVKCRCKVKVGQGNPKWGAEEGKEYYILEILEIIEIRNWNNSKPKAKEAMATATLPDTLTESFQEATAKLNVVNIGIKDIVSSTEQELKEAIEKATAELGNKMRLGGQNND